MFIMVMPRILAEYYRWSWSWGGIRLLKRVNNGGHNDLPCNSDKDAVHRILKQKVNLYGQLLQWSKRTNEILCRCDAPKSTKP